MSDSSASQATTTTNPVTITRQRSTGLLFKPKNRRGSSGQNQDDDDTCPVCACELQLPFRTEKCKHTFCYLCLKNVISHAQQTSWIQPRCPLCREDLDTQALLNAQVEANLYLDDIKSSDVEYVWQYGGRGQGAWLYDPETSNALEEAYKKWDTSRRPPKVVMIRTSSTGSAGMTDGTGKPSSTDAAGATDATGAAGATVDPTSAAGATNTATADDAKDQASTPGTCTSDQSSSTPLAVNSDAVETKSIEHKSATTTAEEDDVNVLSLLGAKRDRQDSSATSVATTVLGSDAGTGVTADGSLIDGNIAKRTHTDDSLQAVSTASSSNQTGDDEEIAGPGSDDSTPAVAATTSVAATSGDDTTAADTSKTTADTPSSDAASSDATSSDAAAVMTADAPAVSSATTAGPTDATSTSTDASASAGADMTATTTTADADPAASPIDTAATPGSTDSAPAIDTALDTEVEEDEDEDMDEEDDDVYSDYDSEDDDPRYSSNMRQRLLNKVPDTFDFVIGATTYTLDFNRMVQYPKLQPTRTRPVFRVRKDSLDGATSSVKGVSGIRFK